QACARGHVVLPARCDVGSVHPGTPDRVHPIPVRTLGATKGTLSVFAQDGRVEADRLERMARIDDFHAVIPAGGIGSRLWPLSRADAPKFLHDLTGSGHSLLRDTWDRLEPLAGPDRIAVVTGRAHRAAVEGQLPGIPDA